MVRAPTMTDATPRDASIVITLARWLSFGRRKATRSAKVGAAFRR
jgi:hypothetical protein